MNQEQKNLIQQLRHGTLNGAERKVAFDLLSRDPNAQAFYDDASSPVSDEKLAEPESCATGPREKSFSKGSYSARQLLEFLGGASLGLVLVGFLILVIAEWFF